MRHARWSDNDHYLGPFTYAKDSRGYKPLAMVICSGDDEYKGCRFRASLFGHTFLSMLPPIVKPWRNKVIAGWDAATTARIGRDWYWDTYEREYGFSYHNGFLQIFFGRQTHSSNDTQSWCCHLPWTQWRFVRRSLYGLQGEHFWTEPKRTGGLGWFDASTKAEDECPSATFKFYDYDGEELTAKTHIQEYEWHFGEGWFKWLKYFRRPMVKRSLDIKFSGETGKRKGSWKGGTIGCSIEMNKNELHESAFRRYCLKNNMTFIKQ